MFTSRWKVLIDESWMHTDTLTRLPVAYSACVFLFFFFQAEDGIRDYKVTGVQTCALPISLEIAHAGFPRIAADQQLERILVDRPFLGVEAVLGDRVRDQVLARDLDLFVLDRKSVV